MTPHIVSHRLAVAALLGALVVPSVASAQTAAGTSTGAPAATLDSPSTPESPAGGEETPVSETLTFEVAVQRALDRNPTSLQAAAEIRRYHALVEQVRAASLPSLTGSAVYTRLDANRVAGGLVLEPESGINLSASLTVPLVNVRGWVQWQQADDREDVARMNAADVRRTLAVATARAYLDVITQKRLLAIAGIARDNAKAHYEFTRAERVGGIGNQLDEARAAQELTTEEVILQNQKVALVRAREALGVLVAGDGSVDVTEWTFGPMPSLGDALVESQRLRTDVRARAVAARAADRTVRQAYADYLPYVSLLASPFYQNPGTATVPSTGWQAQLVLTLPIYDGGLRYGQEHERKATADEAHLSVEATIRQAKSDVRAAFEEMRDADVALDQAHQSALFATKALNLADAAYRGGATTNLEVIDAERRARDAETQAAIAEDAAREARLDLLAAAGRFPSPP
jgi:outer membrane protein TolC